MQEVNPLKSFDNVFKNSDCAYYDMFVTLLKLHPC